MDFFGWSRIQWTRFAITGLLAFVVVPLVAYQNGWDVPTAVLCATGVVILAYTFETQGMRLEMLRANTMAVEPMLTATLGDPPPGGGTGVQLYVRNIGKGPAIHVGIDDITHLDQQQLNGKPYRLRTRFFGPPCVEAGSQEPFTPEFGIQTEDGFHRGDGDWNWTASLNPRTARENYDVLIRYEDMHGRRYRSVMRMGKGGIRLMRTGDPTREERGQTADDRRRDAREPERGVRNLPERVARHQMYASWAQAIAGLLVVIVTLGYVYLTHNLLKSQVEPQVDFELRSMSPGEVALGNNGPYRVVDVTVDADAMTFLGPPLSRPGMSISSGPRVPGVNASHWWRLPALAPGEVKTHDLTEVAMNALKLADSMEQSKRGGNLRDVSPKVRMQVLTFVVLKLTFHRDVDHRRYTIRKTLYVAKASNTGEPIVWDAEGPGSEGLGLKEAVNSIR